MSRDFNKLHPERFETAVAEAHGAIVGWCYGKGQPPPVMTEILKTAYEHAFAVAYNHGFAAALAHTAAVAGATVSHSDTTEAGADG